jgi:UDP:flavonoid glycosyltransferase YjiC (YdhE family)
VDGLSDAQRMRHAGPRLRFSAGPVAMAQALKTARAVVCHGGTGTACQALLAGVPLLLLPMQAEQALMAQRVAASGAGLSIAASEAPARLGSALTDLIGDARIRGAAAALATRHARLSDGKMIARVVERLEEVCSITA